MSISLFKKTLLSTAIISTFAHSSYALDADDSIKKLYVGFEYGASTLLSSKFTIDDIKVKVKGSGVMGVRLGYQFYPNIFLDLSYSKRPSYKMSASLDKNLPAGVKLAWGSANIKYTSYILSLKYAMPNDTIYTPYFGIGAGIAKIAVGGKINVDIPPIAIAPGTIVSFKGHSGKVVKSTKTTPAVEYRLVLMLNSMIQFPFIRIAKLK
jgi:opacity protein-like surface antigen